MPGRGVSRRCCHVIGCRMFPLFPWLHPALLSPETLGKRREMEGNDLEVGFCVGTGASEEQERRNAEFGSLLSQGHLQIAVLQGAGTASREPD